MNRLHITKGLRDGLTRLNCYFKGHQQPLVETSPFWRKEPRIRPRIRPRIDHKKAWRCPRCGKLVFVEGTREVLVIDGSEGEKA